MSTLAAETSSSPWILVALTILAPVVFVLLMATNMARTAELDHPETGHGLKWWAFGVPLLASVALYLPWWNSEFTTSALSWAGLSYALLAALATGLIYAKVSRCMVASHQLLVIAGVVAGACLMWSLDAPRWAGDLLYVLIGSGMVVGAGSAAAVWTLDRRGPKRGGA